MRIAAGGTALLFAQPGLEDVIQDARRPALLFLSRLSQGIRQVMINAAMQIGLAQHKLMPSPEN